MKNILIGLPTLIGIVTMLNGCINIPPFQPTPLNENAKGIATVRSTPYGCKYLAEVEGKDQWKSGMFQPRLQEAREGGLNDLRNNAADIVGNKKKRIVLRIIDEKVNCDAYTCDRDDFYIRSYHVTAQIFECGNKE